MFTYSPSLFNFQEETYDLLAPHHLLEPHNPQLPSSPSPATSPSPPRKSSRNRSTKKGRHSKIITAQGPRDRRMRLSLDVAPKFFGLQDLLGHEKPSRTIQWLLAMSDHAIKRLAPILEYPSFCESPPTSECENIPHTKGKSSATKATKASNSKPKPTHRPKRSTVVQTSELLPPELVRESRAKARARARERTREKERIRCRRLDDGEPPNQSQALGDESGKPDKITLEDIVCGESSVGAGLGLDHISVLDYDHNFVSDLQEQYWMNLVGINAEDQIGF